MIDTIKVGIPLSASQLSKLLKLVANGNRWQWVQFHPKSGDLRFLRLKGVADADQNSFHRNINWDIPDRYTPELTNQETGEVDYKTFLTIELSLPKFTYGHNIHLLYGWFDALKDLKKQFEKQLHCRFPDILQWRIRRLDTCYAWRCPSQATAQDLLDSLKRLRYPRKTPTIWNDAIFFKGNTYSLKFYLKLPEFEVHDMKALIKGKANLDWVNHLQKQATGVIRIEATLRQKYLERKGIKTVADLIQPLTWVEWQLDSEKPDNWDTHAALIAVIMIQKFTNPEIQKNIEQGVETPLVDGVTYSAPAMNMEFRGHQFYFPGGGFTYRKSDHLTTILQFLLNKFIGENRGMDEAGQVKTKLLEKYGSAKAIRLFGFWLHVQKMGAEDAKNVYERSVFFQNKADLKEAGVSLLEPIIKTKLDEKFVESFKFEVPSIHTTNQFDDFKDSGNLLNEKPENADT